MKRLQSAIEFIATMGALVCFLPYGLWCAIHYAWEHPERSAYEANTSGRKTKGKA